MSARFITAVLAAGALVATLATASPAMAGDKQLKRFVGAAVGLYILGQAIENNNRGRVVKQHRPQRKVYRHSHHKSHGKWKPQKRRNNNCRNSGRHNRCW